MQLQELVDIPISDAREVNSTLEVTFRNGHALAVSRANEVRWWREDAVGVVAGWDVMLAMNLTTWGDVDVMDLLTNMLFEPMTPLSPVQPSSPGHVPSPLSTSGRVGPAPALWPLPCPVGQIICLWG